MNSQEMTTSELENVDMVTKEKRKRMFIILIVCVILLICGASAYGIYRRANDKKVRVEPQTTVQCNNSEDTYLVVVNRYMDNEPLIAKESLESAFEFAQRMCRNIPNTKLDYTASFNSQFRVLAHNKYDKYFAQLRDLAAAEGDVDEQVLNGLLTTINDCLHDVRSVDGAFQSDKNAKDLAIELGGPFITHFSQLARTKFDDNFNRLKVLNRLDPNASTVREIFTTMAACLVDIRRAQGFHGTKTAKDLACEYFFSSFEAKWQSRQPDPTVLRDWQNAKAVCPENSHPELTKDSLNALVLELIDGKLPTALNSTADRDELLSLILFLRAFDNSTAYEGISDTASLEAFLFSRRTFAQCYLTFRPAFNVCLAKYDSNQTPTDDELLKLKNELTKILPTLTDPYPSDSLGAEEQKFYFTIQNTKEISTEKLFFEYYQDILRQKLKKLEPCQAIFDKVRQVCSKQFEEVYGKVAKFEDLDDWKLVKLLDARIKDELDLEVEDSFRNLLYNGHFHIFPANEKIREYIFFFFYASPTYQKKFHFGDFFASNNSRREKYFNLLCDFLFERKKYITTVFKNEAEVKSAFKKLAELNSQCGIVETGMAGVGNWHQITLPEKAIPGTAPIICSSADSKFISMLNSFLSSSDKKSRLEDQFRTAVFGCEDTKSITRTDIDSKQVPFNKFYAGTFDEFEKRLFRYVASKLDKDPSKRKPEDYKCAPLGPDFDPSLLKFKTQIDKLVDNPNS